MAAPIPIVKAMKMAGNPVGVDVSRSALCESHELRRVIREKSLKALNLNSQRQPYLEFVAPAALSIYDWYAVRHGHHAISISCHRYFVSQSQAKDDLVEHIFGYHMNDKHLIRQEFDHCEFPMIVDGLVFGVCRLWKWLLGRIPIVDEDNQSNSSIRPSYQPSTKNGLQSAYFSLQQP